jgi:hypothetical protein
MPTSTPSLQQLQRALSIAEKIQMLEEELAAIMGGRQAQETIRAVASEETSAGRRGRRKGQKLSPATIAKMRAAQQARWAKKEGSSTAPAVKGGRGKRTMSPEARARIAASQKARWAKKNGSGAGAVQSITKAVTSATGKLKRVVSPEVKARLAAAMKAHWATAKKQGLPGPNAKR